MLLVLRDDLAINSELLSHITLFRSYGDSYVQFVTSDKICHQILAHQSLNSVDAIVAAISHGDYDLRPILQGHDIGKVGNHRSSSSQGG